MPRQRNKKSQKKLSSPMGNPSFDEEYIEYGSYLNTERPASKDSDSSSKSQSYGSQSRSHDQEKPDDNDASNDDRLFGQMVIQKRQRFSTQEIDILENVYQERKHPSTDVKNNLAHKLNTSFKRVRIWFQNRRSKERRDSGQGSSRNSMPDTDERRDSARRSEPRTRRISNRMSKQASGRHSSMHYGMKQYDDNGGKRHQEKSYHRQKDHIEVNQPEFTVESQPLSSINLWSPAYHCRQLVPSGLYYPGCSPSARVAPTQPGHQGPVSYVNPQRMHDIGQSGLPYGVQILPVIPPASPYLSQSHELDSLGMVDYAEDKRSLEKGEHHIIMNNNTRKRERLENQTEF